jgi:hypothetical protein
MKISLVGYGNIGASLMPHDLSGEKKNERKKLVGNMGKILRPRVHSQQHYRRMVEHMVIVPVLCSWYSLRVEKNNERKKLGGNMGKILRARVHSQQHYRRMVEHMVIVPVLCSWYSLRVSIVTAENFLISFTARAVG